MPQNRPQLRNPGLTDPASVSLCLDTGHVAYVAVHDTSTTGERNSEGRSTRASPPVPDTVSVALAELAGGLREGLLALAVGTGLQVMAAMMEADVTAACGPKGRHDPQRTATRHGHGAGR
jgi:hypothetical protein